MHLYAASLGGELTPGRLGEDHEVVLVVAPDMVAARSAAKTKWGGRGRPHVDALTRLDAIDVTQTERYQEGLRPPATARRRG